MPRPAKIGATRNTSRYMIRVPDELRTAWDAHCAKLGKEVPSMLRALMRYIIKEDLDHEKVAELMLEKGLAYQVDQPDDRPKERMEIRFTVQELDALRLAAEKEGSSPQQWVICAVRAALTNEPQYTLEPSKALWAATTDLRAIGRNLNQIARRLNEGQFNATADLNPSFLEELHQNIKKVTGRVSRLQTASIERWKVQPHE